MAEEKTQKPPQHPEDAEQIAALPLHRRLLLRARNAWRPAASVLAVALALLLTIHAVNGRHGLQVWQQKRAEDQQLRQEIQKLDDENARLHQRIDHLQHDPEAIEHEAREKLHYARPGEKIYTLPRRPQQTAPPPSGK